MNADMYVLHHDETGKSKIATENSWANESKLKDVADNLLTLYLWDEKTIYKDQVIPAGALGCAILNISENDIKNMIALGSLWNFYIDNRQMGVALPYLLPEIKKNTLKINEILWAEIDRFMKENHIDFEYRCSNLENILTINKLQEISCMHFSKQIEGKKNFTITIKDKDDEINELLLLLSIYGSAGYYINEMKKEITMHEEKLRNGRHSYISTFKRIIISESSLFGTCDESVETSASKDKVYICVSLGDSVSKKVITYPTRQVNCNSFGQLFLLDIYEGIRVGRVPRRCPLCDRWYMAGGGNTAKTCCNSCRQSNNQQSYNIQNKNSPREEISEIFAGPFERNNRTNLVEDENAQLIFCHAYDISPSDLTTQNVYWMFQLDPTPPEGYGVSKYIRCAVREQDYIFVLYFLHYYEAHLNELIDQFLNEEHIEYYTLDQFADCKMTCALAIFEKALDLKYYPKGDYRGSIDKIVKESLLEWLKNEELVSFSSIKEYKDYRATFKKYSSSYLPDREFLAHYLPRVQYESDDAAKYLMLLKNQNNYISIDSLIENEDVCLCDIEYEGMPDIIYSGVEYECVTEQINRVLKSLTPREAKVIRLRFGLDDGRQHTIEEVGEYFGVTRERVRQIEARAVRKLHSRKCLIILKDLANDI